MTAHELQIKFGKALKHFRLQRKHSQVFVAMKLGVSQSHYSKLERGEITISLQLFVKTKEIYNITPMALLDFMFEEEKSVVALPVMKEHNSVARVMHY